MAFPVSAALTQTALCNYRCSGSQDGRKKFEKQTQKFCSALDRYLNLSTKKLEEHTLREVGAEWGWRMHEV